nr:hypothetical protein [Clostridia bacterium]
MNEMYWITRLDTLHYVMAAISVLVGIYFCSMWFLKSLLLPKGDGMEEDGQMYHDWITRRVRLSGIVFFLSLFYVLAVPTSEDMTKIMASETEETLHCPRDRDAEVSDTDGYEPLTVIKETE